MQLTGLKANTWIGLWQAAQSRVEAAASLEEAAQGFVDQLYTPFADEIVLLRLFMTVRYRDLSEGNRRFVDARASELGVIEGIADHTPVLTLLGSRGREPAWNDHRQSQHHLGIPLVSEAFVAEIPMVSQLLRQLGLQVDWLDRTGGDLTLRDGLFYVADATQAKDDQGRDIIPRQDFVAQYGVKTVFGLGGRYLLGEKNLLSTIAFCNTDLAAETARLLLPVLRPYKVTTGELLKQGKIFA